MKRFMADRTRNRVANGQLEVSSIFKWFKEDFEKGHLGLNKVEDVFARFATAADPQPGRAGPAEGPSPARDPSGLRLAAERWGAVTPLTP
jgi:hypothetical protein